MTHTLIGWALIAAACALSWWATRRQMEREERLQEEDQCVSL